MKTVFNKEVLMVPGWGRGHVMRGGMGRGRRRRRGSGGKGWQSKFRGCGYRMTAPRMAVIEELSKTKEHLSVEDIYMRIHKTDPGIGLTSIYRTLDLLVQMGEVVKFDVGDKKARYEFAAETEGKGHHHHLVCSGCGEVIDYSEFVEEEKELIEKIEKRLSKKYGFDIKNHLIQFQGLCGKCKKEGGE